MEIVFGKYRNVDVTRQGWYYHGDGGFRFISLKRAVVMVLSIWI